MFSIQLWLSLILDLIVTAIAVTTVLASQVHGQSPGGAFGVALSNVVSYKSDSDILDPGLDSYGNINGCDIQTEGSHSGNLIGAFTRGSYCSQRELAILRSNSIQKFD